MLNSKQKKVAFELTGNTIVSASPGTGKTKTLVARAQKKLESMPKHKSLALITYTNAGADEISSRLHIDEKDIFIGTIHRFCLEFILRPFSWIYKWDKPRIITFDELNEFIEINIDIDLGDRPLEELGKLKRLLDGELDRSIDWGNTESLEYIAELYFAFLASKKAIDFNEILYKSYKIISENRFVSDSLANKFYEISIDEFQDTNIFQYEILKAINQTPTCTFFMVGDEKQKIYKFAGAIDNAFENATNDFNATIENLDVTYRSTTNIINGYSSLFANHPQLENESKYKDVDYKIIISETTNQNNNAYIETTIKTLVEKCNASLSDIAILTTSWRDAFFISRSLRQKYHVVGLGALPHRSMNSSTFTLIRCLSRFTFAPTIRNLRVIRRNVEFHALENSILFTEKELTYSVNSLITKFKELNFESTLLEGLNLLKTIFDDVFKIDNSDIKEIANNISNEEAEIWTLEKYFKTVSGIDGITINTIHQAKGLEYEIVFLNGVSENKIPYQRLLERNGNNWIYEQLTDESLENGRTLFYVGISRAKAVLILIHNWKPSLFISKIKEVNN
ncbi:UvrD-helicase domain-containing protein [Myroides odoratimimus]|uniref:UvrD-helicase domain-containing protein n=1 Tax=Myroides odoratimimus TaxID=76832 RepID=UPI0025783C0E|nr:ATP-dependent helicase [Myroides odoratimimus]MDM1086723.1 ATP-dependent helicase [Myroides odoratimimus]